jgi:hypothetical protein
MTAGKNRARCKKTTEKIYLTKSLTRAKIIWYNFGAPQMRMILIRIWKKSQKKKKKKKTRRSGLSYF